MDTANGPRKLIRNSKNWPSVRLVIGIAAAWLLMLAVLCILDNRPEHLREVRIKGPVFLYWHGE